MFMVCFVCFPHCDDIAIVASPEKSDPLMNDYFVNYEISRAIERDTNTYPELIITTGHHAEHDKQPSGYREDQKEQIIALEETLRAGVMILVKRPKKTMHDEFMRRPGNGFHKNKTG
jgi:hypothetical protein